MATSRWLRIAMLWIVGIGVGMALLSMFGSPVIGNASSGVIVIVGEIPVWLPVALLADLILLLVLTALWVSRR